MSDVVRGSHVMWRLLQLLCPPLVENSLSHLMLSAANLFLSILSGSIMIWASSCTIMAFSPIRSGEWYSQWWRRLARISFGKLNIIFYYYSFFYFSFMTLIVSKKKLQDSFDINLQDETTFKCIDEQMRKV